MTSFVVDASVVVKWYLQEEYSDHALTLVSRDYRLHAPDFLLAEVHNTLCAKIRQGQMTIREANIVREGLADRRAVPARLHPSPRLYTDAFRLADRTFKSFYDCLYLALAELLGYPLVTADLRFCGGMEGTPYESLVVPIESIPLSS